MILQHGPQDFSNCCMLNNTPRMHMWPQQTPKQRQLGDAIGAMRCTGTTRTATRIQGRPAADAPLTAPTSWRWWTTSASFCCKVCLHPFDVAAAAMQSCTTRTRHVGYVLPVTSIAMCALILACSRVHPHAPGMWRLLCEHAAALSLSQSSGCEVRHTFDTACMHAGTGASAEGNEKGWGRRPFLDAIDVDSGKKERLWQSSPPFYESAGTLLTEPDKPVRCACSAVQHHMYALQVLVAACLFALLHSTSQARGVPIYISSLVAVRKSAVAEKLPQNWLACALNARPNGAMRVGPHCKACSRPITMSYR